MHEIGYEDLMDVDLDFANLIPNPPGSSVSPCMIVPYPGIGGGGTGGVGGAQRRMAGRAAWRHGLRRDGADCRGNGAARRG